MCLILDSDIVHKVFPSPSADFKAIHLALTSGRAKCVYGGGLTREYEKIASFKRFLRLLDQQGAAKQFPDSSVDSEAQRLEASGLCVSNDFHILGLAIVSKARLVCSDDKRLATDCTNPSILSNPRGNIYKYAAHSHLIKEHCG